MADPNGTALLAQKVRCASRAWWWSFAVYFALYMFAWLAMLLFLNTGIVKDILPLWGGVSEEVARTIWIGTIALMKVFFLLWFVFGVFLYRWEKNLRTLN